MKDKKISNGWKIVIACILIQAVPYNILSNLQGQFMAFVIADKGLGFNVATFSLIFTIGTLVSAVAAPLVSGLFKKCNIKALYIAGAILGCGGFAAYSLATAPWQYYIIAAVMQVGCAIISALGVPLLINSWFDNSSKGKALSIAMAGGSVGNIFLQACSVTLISTLGFRKAYLMFGLAGLIVAIPVILFIIRLPKNDTEIVRGNASNEENKEVDSNWGYTVKEAVKTKGFIFLTGAFFFVGIYVAALAMQYPNFLHQNHAVNTGIVGAVFAIAGLFGALLGGSLFDKLGSFKTILIAGIIAAISCIALMFSLDVTPLAYVFGATKGLSVFAYTMGPALLAGKLFGNKEYAGILGLIQLVFGMGFAAGSSLFGVIVNAAGYRVAWLVVLASIVVAYAGILTSIKLMEKANIAKKSEEKNVA